MTREKKIRMKCMVEIQFEGWGDKPYFKEMMREAVKDLHYDATGAGTRGKIAGSATVTIKKPSKLVSCEELP